MLGEDEKEKEREREQKAEERRLLEIGDWRLGIGIGIRRQGTSRWSRKKRGRGDARVHFGRKMELKRPKAIAPLLCGVLCVRKGRDPPPPRNRRRHLRELLLRTSTAHAHTATSAPAPRPPPWPTFLTPSTLAALYLLSSSSARRAISASMSRLATSNVGSMRYASASASSAARPRAAAAAALASFSAASVASSFSRRRRPRPSAAPPPRTPRVDSVGGWVEWGVEWGLRQAVDWLEKNEEGIHIARGQVSENVALITTASDDRTPTSDKM